MTATTQTGLDLILSAARAHGENSEPDHEVGDLQAVLRAAWEIMTPGQRAALLSDSTVAEQLGSELPEGDDGTPGDERIEAALRLELDAAKAGASLYDLLVAAHPGFLDDTDVDGSDLIDWVNENMALIKATKPAEPTAGYVELVVTMRSRTTFGKDTTTIRVFAGQSAAEVAAEAAQGYGATVVSIAYQDGTPFKGPDACKQCGSDMDGEYCSDQSCVYSDWPQAVLRKDITVFDAEELKSKYGITKRTRAAD